MNAPESGLDVPAEQAAAAIEAAHAGDFGVHPALLDAALGSLRAADRAARSAVRQAEQHLKRQKRDRQQARERADRRSGAAQRSLPDAGIPKIVAGAMKRRAQVSAGRADDVHARRVDDARARLGEAEALVRDDDTIIVGNATSCFS